MIKEIYLPTEYDIEIIPVVKSLIFEEKIENL